MSITTTQQKLITKALKVMEAQAKESTESFTNSDFAKNFCRLQIANELEEIFGVAFLDNQNKLISFEKLFRGTVNEATVYPRVIVRKAIEHNAVKVILTHNHPSGRVTASQSDIEVTEKIKTILKIIDCQVLDHVIVTTSQALSMAETGIL